MAILDDDSGLEVHILVDGQPLKEHRDSDGEQEHLLANLAYLEVNGSVLFAIRIKLPKGFRPAADGIRYQCTFDGGDAFAWRLSSETYSKYDKYSIISHVTKTVNGLNAHFQPKFAALNLTEDKITKEEASKFRGLGEIAVSFFEATAIKLPRKKPKTTTVTSHHAAARAAQQHTSTTTPKPALTTLAASSIPERALKGRAQSFGISMDEIFLPATTVQPLITKSTNSRPASATLEDEVKWTTTGPPFATFTFRYRSRADLVKSGIIEPPTRDQEIATMSADQLRAALRERDAAYEATLELNQRIKRERAEKDTDRAPKRSKLPVETEVLDLTGD